MHLKMLSAKVLCQGLTFEILHMYLKISWKMEHLLYGANAPFFEIFSKVFKTLLKFVLNFFQCLKIEKDVMI